jgi:tRNA dimethylallyltransferase
LIVLFGPTATGKTKVAIELAKRIDAEIISADSMQVYRGMDIGTAKPTLEERQGIPHHLIDIRNPDETWTVSDFVSEVKKLKSEIVKRGKVPIMVGGTGLYLWALLEGFSFPIAPADKELRKRLEITPTALLYARLATVDPGAAGKIHPNDRKRIVRALEVYELTGRPISEWQKKNVAAAFGSPFKGSLPPEATSSNPEYLLIGLNLPRAQLYERINQRVDSMMEKGLIEEVRSLLAKGYSKELPSFQALGYKEVVDYLFGKWTKEQMIEELKKRTRNFARRQMTWFKRFSSVHWIEANLSTIEIINKILSLLHI